MKREGLFRYRDDVVVGFASRESKQKYVAAISHFDDLLLKENDSNKKKSRAISLNTHCPWSSKKVAKDSLTKYRDVKVGFCNPSCRDQFETATQQFDSFIIEGRKRDTPASEGKPSRKKQKVEVDNNIQSEKCGRCSWAKDPVFHHYHDTEWGFPSRDDDRYLFEMLILEGAQAGLSWRTVLLKRENYKLAFDNFDAAKVATYNDTKVASLLENEGIIRNRLKILSTITNAQATLKVREEFGSFSEYIWRFVDNEPIVNCPTHYSEMPTTSPQSDALSKDLKKRGFKFVGSTIIYAYMQAVGMVNDHEKTCPQKNLS